MPEQMQASALRVEMTTCRYWIALPAARTGHLYATGISGPVQTSLRRCAVAPLHRYTVTRDAKRQTPITPNLQERTLASTADIVALIDAISLVSPIDYFGQS